MNKGGEFMINTISEKIKHLRVKKGLSLRDLSQKTGIAFSTLSLIENGKTSPRPKTAKAIADALEVDFDEIFKIV